MNPTHLLDTSVYSQPIRPQPHPAVMKRWQALGDAALVTSSICEGEILFGIKKKGSKKMADGYDPILNGLIKSLYVESMFAEAYAELRTACETKGTPVADMDLLIAATAKANNLIIATLNKKDFAVIPGVEIEDWSTT